MPGEIHEIEGKEWIIGLDMVFSVVPGSTDIPDQDLCQDCLVTVVSEWIADQRAAS
jgi:hypothetical protein